MGRLDADAVARGRLQQCHVASGPNGISRSLNAVDGVHVARLFTWALGAVAVAAGLIVSSAAYALAPTQPSLDQSRNGTAAAPTSPVDFQNGNAGASNSHYIEGMSIPYRIVFPNLELGTHTVIIEWDILQGGLHAIDYITHYDRLQPHTVFTPAHAQESVNPLVGIAGSFGPPTTFPIPPPSASGSPVGGQPLTSFNALPAAERVLTMYNGTISSATYVSQGSLAASQSSTSIRITFNATSSNVVLAWGGHIASRADWGAGASAGQINGSSYHSRLIDLDGTGGNQDRSLSASAVLAPVACVLTGPTTSCPSVTETFGSQTSGTSYLWSVTGDASIVGSNTGSTVQVLVADVCGGSYTVQLQQTDPVGTTTCTRVVPIQDALPPVITCPADIVVECGASIDPSFTGTATAVDGCGPNVTITFGDAGRAPAFVTAACVPREPIERTWTATDACGNTSSCVQLISFVDTTPPVLTCPPDIIVECGASIDPIDTGSPSSTDSCDPTVTITFGDATRAPGFAAATACVIPPIERTWTATDDCGNTTTCVQLITFVDTTPPVLTCPADVTLECGASSDPAETGSATAIDGCDPTITITFGDASRGPALATAAHADGCAGPGIDRTWTATDDCGNTSTCVQHISFVDTTPPAITCPADVTLECGASVDPAQTGSATATDGCDPSITITFGDAGRAPAFATAACVPREPIERTWTATDDCGNTSSCVQLISFVDTTPPVLTCPPDITVECGASIDPIDTGSPSSTDSCDPTVTITFGDATRAPGFAAATACVIPPIERTWTATDDCGNTTTCVQLITFVDTTPPVLTCPADVTLECGASSDPAETGSATAIDGCDPTITITFGDASRGPALATAAHADGCAGPGIDRTWTATDDCGNTSTCVQHISFVDTTPPAITCPADVTLECGASVDPAQTGSATAIDGCDPSITITFGDAGRGPALATAANGAPCAGSGIDRTWTATDDCGNSSSCVQHISFVDTTPPVITCPADVALECGSPSDPEHTGSATATDGCDPTITITFGDATRAPALRSGPVTAATCAGAIIDRTWTARDDCGNSSSCVQVITFVDTAPPSIDCPDDVVRPACDNVVTWEANATDACDAAPIANFVPPSGTAFPLGTTTVTGTATDACGNTATCSFTVTVSVTAAPPITGPAAVCKGQAALLCGVEGAASYAWTGPGGFTGSERCVSVTAAGTYVLEATFAGQKCKTRSEHVLGIADPPACAIDGPSTVCSGGQATLCGPNGNYGYAWTGPGGYTAATACITVSAAGSYQLVVTDLETKCASLACTHELGLGVCDLVCPRTAGFWGAQCDQVPTGQTKFSAAQMALITGLVDTKVAIFSWPDAQDFSRFCTTVSTSGSMDQRRQAKRQFAAFLANVSTGELGLIASNGIQVSLSASTVVSCGGLSSTTVGALIGEVDALLVSLEPQSLTNATVKARYSQVITCLNAINNAVGFTTVCSSAAPENALYQDPPSTAGVGDQTLELRRPTPNPFTSATRIAYEIPTGERDAFVGVFDVAGRNVKTLVSGSAAPGRYEISWDGRDDHGARVKSGVYFVRIVAGGTARTLPVVYLDR